MKLRNLTDSQVESRIRNFNILDMIADIQELLRWMYDKIIAQEAAVLPTASESVAGVIDFPTVRDAVADIPVYNSVLEATTALGEGKLFRYSAINTDSVVSPEDSVVGVTGTALT